MRKSRRFGGHTLSRADHGKLVSLIEMTAGSLGLHKKAFKTEKALWDAIDLLVGLKPRAGEAFTTSLLRIHGSVAFMGKEKRQALVRAANKAALMAVLGVSSIKEHQPRVTAKSDGPTGKVKDDFYRSWEWRTLRMEVLKEHGRACQCCGAEPGMKTASGEPVRICVDHIKPLSKHWHLRLEKTNLQVLCDECNMGKGNWDETDFREPPAPDEWICSDHGIDARILEQLTDHTTGRLQ